MRLIIDAAHAGDGQAASVLEELAVFLGSAVANIVAVVDPALVVFGGGLSHAGDLLVGPVRRVVSRIVPNVPALLISALGDEAQLMGSVYSAMELAETRLFAIAGNLDASPEVPVRSRASGRV
jgi:predicted NBD/HSP70 family sugar kinase